MACSTVSSPATCLASTAWLNASSSWPSNRTDARALATASPNRLREVAVPWSQIEEFWGQADPSGLAAFLEDVSELAKHSRSRSERLYCWVCV